MTYENISNQKEPDTPLLLNIGERRKHLLEPFQVPEDTGKTKSNSYIICAHYEGEEIPCIFPGVEFVEFSNKDDWIAATWIDIPFDSFQNNYDEVIKKVKDATKLESNWNSYEGEKISKTTSGRAIIFLYDLFRVLKNKGVELPKPFTAPCSDGSIQFEWEMQEKEFEVSIPPTEEEKISFLRTKEDEYEEGFIDNPSELSEYFFWLIIDDR